jgi:hypothetical protein
MQLLSLFLELHELNDSVVESLFFGVIGESQFFDRFGVITYHGSRFASSWGSDFCLGLSWEGLVQVIHKLKKTN